MPITAETRAKAEDHRGDERPAEELPLAAALLHEAFAFVTNAENRR